MPRFLGFIKWVVVPITVGCAGYFFVAPLLTSSPVNVTPEKPKAPQTLPAGPVVDVDVETPKPPRRKRRTKKKPKPANTASTPAPSTPVAPPEEPPATDGGGSGGAATAGDDGTPPDSETRIG